MGEKAAAVTRRFGDHDQDGRELRTDAERRLWRGRLCLSGAGAAARLRWEPRSRRQLDRRRGVVWHRRARVGRSHHGESLALRATRDSRLAALHLVPERVELLERGLADLEAALLGHSLDG